MIDQTAFIAPGAVVVGRVSLGKHSSIWYNAVVRADMDSITVGDETNIQDSCVIHVDEGYPCVIGSRVGVGHRVVLHGCTIEDECLIGMGSVLLNGVHVGRGSVIGAGAVLTEEMDVPPGSLVVGVPARVIRPIDETLRARIDANWTHYVAEAEEHKTGRYPLHH